MKTFRAFIAEMKKPRYEVPAEPGSTPLKPGHVRLYHQTGEKALNSIRHTGIERRQPHEGPAGIYASKPDSQNRGFYSKATDTPTAEFQVPEHEYDAPFVHKDKVPAKDIIAHKEWHHTVRHIDKDPKLKDEVLRGEHDDLMKDKGSKYSKAIRFIKKREAAKNK